LKPCLSLARESGGDQGERHGGGVRRHRRWWRWREGWRQAARAADGENGHASDIVFRAWGDLRCGTGGMMCMGNMITRRNVPI
jgi:hypothetical protein